MRHFKVTHSTYLNSLIVSHKSQSEHVYQLIRVCDFLVYTVKQSDNQSPVITITCNWTTINDTTWHWYAMKRSLQPSFHPPEVWITLQASAKSSCWWFSWSPRCRRGCWLMTNDTVRLFRSKSPVSDVLSIIGRVDLHQSQMRADPNTAVTMLTDTLL